MELDIRSIDLNKEQIERAEYIARLWNSKGFISYKQVKPRVDPLKIHRWGAYSLVAADIMFPRIHWVFEYKPLGDKGEPDGIHENGLTIELKSSTYPKDPYWKFYPEFDTLRADVFIGATIHQYDLPNDIKFWGALNAIDYNEIMKTRSLTEFVKGRPMRYIKADDLRPINWRIV